MAGLLGKSCLSLNSRWSISVAPVRGGTYFLCRRKESRQRKPEADRAALTATLQQLAGQCHEEVRDYLKVLQRTGQIRDELSGSALSDDDDGGQWYLLAVPCVMAH
jgi:hypothetical protein